MTILGIDPGYAIIGFGVLKKEGYKVVDYGVITTPKEMAMSDRLDTIFLGIGELIDTFKPDEVAIEELFFNTNITTDIAVAEARGAIIVACRERHIPVYEYTPLQIKQALTGVGRAEKKQVQFMVKSILGLESVPKPDDAADALAAALTHAQTNNLLVKNNF